MIQSGLIDLHVHTNMSFDGHRGIFDTMNAAVKNNVRTVSLTEHYNLDSYTIAVKIARNFIELIPGTELGTNVRDLSKKGRKKPHCHILVYYPDDKIKDIIRLMVEKRNNSIIEVNLLSPVNLILLVKLIGGVAVLAHPRSLHLDKSDLRIYVKSLKDAGLDGFELFNPHTGEYFEDFSEICGEFELIPTVGSDDHGKGDSSVEIGKGIKNNLCVEDYTIIERMKFARYDSLKSNFFAV